MSATIIWMRAGRSIAASREERLSREERGSEGGTDAREELGPCGAAPCVVVLCVESGDEPGRLGEDGIAVLRDR